VSGLEVYFEDVDSFKIDRKELQQQLEYLAKNEKKVLGEITLVFCSDDYLLKMNEQYLKHDYYTDIITFDYSEKSFISGDLFISTERVSENAVKFATSFAKELYRVIFHGVLHLAGYNDKTGVQQQQMREKEDNYLKGTDFDKVAL
jgi:probable rRNA maturation factor